MEPRFSLRKEVRVKAGKGIYILKHGRLFMSIVLQSYVQTPINFKVLTVFKFKSHNMFWSISIRISNEETAATVSLQTSIHTTQRTSHQKF
jgi:hypothetical protein